jgi:hypothetical protein
VCGRFCGLCEVNSDEVSFVRRLSGSLSSFEVSLLRASVVRWYNVPFF